MSFVQPQENLQNFGLKKGMDVADFGAGAGHYTLEAAKIVGDNGHVCGIEIQKELVSKINNEAEKEGLSNIDVVWGDLEKSGGSTLDEESVDAVIISNILFQAQDPASILREAYRILRSGGTVLVIDWSDTYGGLGPPADRLITQDDIVGQAEKLNLSLSREISAGEHHWGVILQKQ